MPKLFYPDFFNDVFGPVMQPGSSGSFAGTSRVARAASHSITSGLKRAKIRFNPNDRKNFRKLGNMMEDRGYLGGLQDFATDDERLFRAHELAREKGVSYEFGILDEENGYPDSVQFDLEGRSGERGNFIGASIGGGMITSYEINGFPVRWQADTHALLLRGPERYAAQLEQFLAAHAGSLVEKKEYAGKKNEKALFIEFSAPLSGDELGALFSPDDYRVFPALLPVVSFSGRKEQLFTTVDAWIAYAEQEGISFADAAVRYEQNFSLWSEKEIWDYFEYIRGILDYQIHALEILGYDKVPDTPLLPVYGRLWNTYKKEGKVLQDPLASRIMDYAFSVNAKIPGVKIVPGPMGTGGGYLFSALEAVREARGFSREKQLEGLAVAAGLGAIAFTHARASGVSGCVGESGVCCAMASGAVVWMAGGTGAQVQNAASMALQANIGIPCDPMPGGLEFPCLTRTVRAALTAPLYADMALSGIDSLISYHEMLHAIEQNRRQYPQAVCGALCGVNCTPTADRCQKFLSDDIMGGKIRYEAV
ncbi:MAG: L-serine ammonia-lyase, iron-sulfur-dependent, subunit alpha [Spirochaetaceae bacterium]|jgi:L-serine dehydratase|nr:L-serine ammonia-lyase, iron-sulfur-dependent, subunit alpha [Spirochaetaceae bacterium]